MKQKSFDEEMKALFGGKVYRLALSSGCSCPNRDGTLGTGGCIFCSAGGSGEFAAPASLPVEEQLLKAKERVSRKLSGNFAGYMAYFQSFSNTWAPADRLRELFYSAIRPDDVLALSVATRPDCLPGETVRLLSELNRQKPVWVELGLQTSDEETAARIRRGYSLPVFEDAVFRLKRAGLRTVVHMIIGLPGEDREKTEETARYLAEFCRRDNPLLKPEVVLPGEKSVSCETDKSFIYSVKEIKEYNKYNFDYKRNIDGIKLQILQVLRGTDLEKEYRQDPGILPAYSPEEYASVLKEILEILPEEITVHRLTGDPPKALLVSPAWTADKKRVLNTLRRVLS